MEQHSFLGRGWSFPPEFRKYTEPTEMVTEEEDIRQSLLILMHTSPGERVHRYDFGCGLDRFVYEEMTQTTRTLMQDAIEKAVLWFEPRVTLVNTDIKEAGEALLTVELKYLVRRTNRRSNVVFPFYLREGSEINI